MYIVLRVLNSWLSERPWVRLASLLGRVLFIVALVVVVLDRRVTPRLGVALGWFSGVWLEALWLIHRRSPLGVQ